MNINEEICAGCGRCVKMYPESFEMIDMVSQIKDDARPSEVSDMSDHCPFGAINLE